MNHDHFESLLPLYAAGQLTETERAEIEAHLAVCAECQADLELWTSVSIEIETANHALALPAEASVVERALEQIYKRNRLTIAFTRAWQLLQAQAFLVQREMWPASAAVMALGVIVALVSKHAGIVYFIAPMVASAMLAALSGQENDPAYELTAATPTSPWKILLARLSIVSGYNLLLTLVATLVLLVIVPSGLLGVLILSWLGPMTFLSALALLLSLWIGNSNAIAIAYLLWIAQYVPYQSISIWTVSPVWLSATLAYQQFWHSPMLLLFLSVFLISVALWSANRPVFRLIQGIG